MTAFLRVRCVGLQQSDNENRITVSWIEPDGVPREHTVNQRTLKRFSSAEEIKAALDSWTSNSFGYELDDIWFHLNRSGTWAIATGASPPTVWPEDEPPL